MQSSSRKINQKVKLLKLLFFFKFFRTSNEQLPCLAKNFSAGISKLKIAVFVSKNQSKSKTFETSLFFSNSSELRTNNYRAWRKTFRQGYQNWEMQFSSQKINQKIKLLKILFFSNSSQLWTNNCRAWRKTFRQGYQNWEMQFSSQKINQKIKLLKILFSFKFFRTLNEHLPCLTKKFSAMISKLEIVLLFLQSVLLGKKYFFESFVNFHLFRTWNINF